MAKREPIPAGDVALYAITTGSWYKQHCTRARECFVPLIKWPFWIEWVNGVVIPGYRRETNDWRPIKEVDVARELAAYYHAHIVELNAHSEGKAYG